jgi:hypothetical protein
MDSFLGPLAAVVVWQHVVFNMAVTALTVWAIYGIASLTSDKNPIEACDASFESRVCIEVVHVHVHQRPCRHYFVSFRGSNQFRRRIRCRTCGATWSIPVVPGDASASDSDSD